jgi:prolyl-tRNA synthetase
VEVLDDSEKSYGWKVNESEIRGVPLMISIGTRELDEKTATVNFRLNKMNHKLVRFTEIGKRVEEMLSKAQDEMYKKAHKFLKENIRDARDYKSFKEIMKTKRGFIKAFWCESSKCEEKIKEETKATVRLRPLNAKKRSGKCIYCGKKAEYIWYFGQAY